jgi:catechol 2,3-dioxygenase-like lactoylglutathione lyase family enzyme
MGDSRRQRGPLVRALDHLVLTVRDVGRTCDFYERALGMESITFSGRRALRFGEQKINVHEAGHEFEPKAARPVPGSADLCFVTDLAPQEVIAHLTSCGVDIEEGPVERIGALGPIISVYLRDPDG